MHRNYCRCSSYLAVIAPGQRIAAVSGGGRNRRGAGQEACAAAGLVVPLSFNILVLTRGSEYELLNWRFTGHFS